MPEKRTDGPYIWVTTLAKLLTGENWLTSTNFAGSPPAPGPAVEPLLFDSWEGRIPG